MRRERRNRGSEWELDWVKCYGGGQTDQGEVLDDCYHVTSASGTLRSDVTLLQLPLSLDVSSVECGIVEGKWEPGKKPPNLMRETGEENRKTTKNILAP